MRTVRVVHEKDSLGMSFYFEVNGIPMFAKGTNLIPSDALLPRVTRERYVRLLDDVQAAHMNMIRVWGGGIYEDDAFLRKRIKGDSCLAGFYVCVYTLSARSGFPETSFGRSSI